VIPPWNASRSSSPANLDAFLNTLAIIGIGGSRILLQPPPEARIAALQSADTADLAGWVQAASSTRKSQQE
jgi:hypothetical protein